MKQKTFFFIQPQIVGNAEKWSYSFYPVGIVPSKNLEVIGNIYENTEPSKK